jgi:hypothetical protein
LNSHRSQRAGILLDLALIVLLTAVLIAPWFKAGYTTNWGSIESTFIADARFLMEHWPHPQWQPLWYTGTRFDYVYPPALRYGTSLIAKVFGILPVRGYRLYTGGFYCLGIAGVYLLIRVGARSRGAAWLGAAAAALISPAFLILKPFRVDSPHWMPQRLNVLVRYGEGPHMTALALIPFVLAFTWIALERRRWSALAFAAILSAAVIANNLYGATALAIFYPILVFSLWITHENRRMFLPAMAIPVLAYGLSAMWLTPSFVMITRQNLAYVAHPGNTWSAVVAMLVAAAFAAASWKFARGKPERAWITFCTGCAVALSLLVAGVVLFNFRVGGEFARLIPELDLVYILLAVTFLAWLWKRSGWSPRLAAAVIVVAAFATSIDFLRHAWDEPVPLPNYQNRVEYRIQDWVWKNMPDARMYATGSVRFWFNAWHDLPQMTGGSDQGLLNGWPQYAAWELRFGQDAEPGILWMQALGVDAVYVSDSRSEELYRDFLNPRKFAGSLPVLYDDQRGNVIYGVPRRYKARVRVVETAELDRVQPPQGLQFVEHLQAYVDVVEHGPDTQGSLVREGTDAMTVRATVGAGQSIVVQESYDPAWQASIKGKPVTLRKDAMGFMVMDLPPGEYEIHLRFPTALENRVGQAVTALTWLGLLFGSWRTRTKNRRIFQRVGGSGGREV